MISQWAGSNGPRVMSTTPRWSRPLAWGLGAVGATGLAGSILLSLVTGRSDPASQAAASLLIVGVPTALGTLLALRLPANPIGWLMTVGGVVWSANDAARSVVTSALEDGREVSTALGLVAVLNEWIWPLGVLCSLGLPILLFPDGRIRCARWRWVLATMIGGCAVTILSAAISTEPIPNEPDPASPLTSPLAVASLATVNKVASEVGPTMLVVSMAVALLAVVLRLRTATGTERQQLRWVNSGALLAIAGVLVFPVAGLADVPESAVDFVFTLGFACLPLSIAVAVLRYRLFDLDRVISRTVTYAALTGLLVASYAGLVTAVSRLTPSSSSLAVASSTLAVAALFQPLRRWLQRAVDRRFNRARYDAARTVEEFSLRLRDEVDLESVRNDLLLVVRESVQPSTVGLWLRAGS